MPDYNPTIDKLIAKSSEGKVPWKPTYEPDTFIAALEGAISFEIDKSEHGETYSFFMKDSKGTIIIELVAQNVETYDAAFRDDDIYFKKLRVLYEDARVIALDVKGKMATAEELLDNL